MQIESVTSMQLNGPFASSPLLFSLWLSQVFISFFKYPSTPYTHVSRLPCLLANRRRSLFAITPSSSFHSIKIPISAMSRVGYGCGAKRLLIFSRPTPPSHSHFLRALAPTLSLFSQVSSTSCWLLT